MKLRLAAFVWFAALAACASPSSEVDETAAPLSCKVACSCSNCSDADLESCIEDVEGLTNDANDAECNGSLKAYLSCLAHDTECTDGELDTSICGPEDEQLRTCIHPPPAKSPDQTSGSSSSSSSSTGTGGGTCAYTYDGVCDEPEGTGYCPEGTDSYDCGG
jgi:hypothetical protein